ncbi:unnamed protein product [Caenorhabditis brenneri]
MAGPSPINPITNRPTVEKIRELLQENDPEVDPYHTPPAPEFVVYYRMVRDRIRRFGENVHLAMRRVEYQIFD